jgi:hypothetical protein
MSQIQSYNALIDRFKAFADGHYLIKHFSHGQIDVSDLDKFPMYPFMHVIPSLVNYAEGQKTFSFDVVLADLPRDKDWKPEYQREVLSDLQRIAEDLFAEIQQNQVLFGSMIQLQNASIEPFMQEYKHVLTGWKLTFQMIVPYYWDACTTPASWNDYVSNLDGGNSTVLTFGMSTNLDGSGVVTLDNDEEAPSPNHYYGTDAEGVKGWFVLPSGNTFDCEDLLGCTVFTDLQTEVGLKANIADISPVGLSNDYNDLDNLPTIPAAQVNADWNATSGVAEILNKPSGLPTSLVNHEVKLGSTMTKGTPVYVSSADGTNMIVSPASNTSELTSSKTMGLLMTGGNTNAKVQVVTEGLLAGLNTTAASIGDPVWLGSTGTLLYGIANKPVAPLHMVSIGVVTRVNANNGEIFVKVQNGFEIEELHNVLIQSVANNQVLQYETATSLWKNKTLDKTSVGLSNVDNTSDVNKPVSTATQTALNLKENSANKQNSLAIDGSGTKFPTVDAVNSLSIIDKYKRGIQYFTDFEGTASVTPNFAAFSVGGSVNRLVILVPNATNNQIGIAQYQTGTTATGYFTHTSEGFFGRQFFFGGGSWVFETFLCVETLSDAANRFRFVSGFGDQATNSSEGNGAFFTYDEGGIQNGTVASPNWQCVTSVASVRTLTTTTAVTAGAWTKLRIEVNASGTSVAFFINGTLVATHTTNIPIWVSPSNTRGFNVKQSILKSIGTTNRSVFCDYLGYENILTTPRT